MPRRLPCCPGPGEPLECGEPVSPLTACSAQICRARHMKSFLPSLLTVVPLWFAVATLPVAASGVEPCRIEVVEKGTGWPVPLVELRTLHQVRFVTDNAGVIAFDLPELMGRETWFDVIGHGYEVPKDGFGYRGVRLTPKPGGTLKVEVDRTILARRLGRSTGAGLFAESQKLGRELDWHESGILGSDSVQNAVHRGKLFWAWGDTTLPNYPLGIFDMTSATTAVQPLDAFEPPLRLKLDYFTGAQGRPRGVAKMPGSGPTWISGYVSLPDKTGDSATGKHLREDQAAAGGLRVRALRVERSECDVRAAPRHLVEVRRTPETAAGPGRTACLLERLAGEGVGPVRHFAADLALSGHL